VLRSKSNQKSRLREQAQTHLWCKNAVPILLAVSNDPSGCSTLPYASVKADITEKGKVPTMCINTKFNNGPPSTFHKWFLHPFRTAAIAVLGIPEAVSHRSQSLPCVTVRTNLHIMTGMEFRVRTYGNYASDLWEKMS
jgi:hypothetical protein